MRVHLGLGEAEKQDGGESIYLDVSYNLTGKALAFSVGVVTS